MYSLGFSSFRHLMDLWDEAVEQEKHADQIHAMIDGNGLIVFFYKDGEVFGAPEEGRLVFAKMKQPDEDTNSDWVKEASFTAFRLKDALEGREVASLFQKKDLKTLKVISREKAVHLLSKKPKTKQDQKQLSPPHGKDGAGFIQIKDRQ